MQTQAYFRLAFLSKIHWEVKQQRRERQWKLHLKLNIWEMVTILLLLLIPLLFIVGRSRCKWTGWSAVEVNVENERLLLCVHAVAKTLDLEISRFHFADYIKGLY